MMSDVKNGASLKHVFYVFLGFYILNLLIPIIGPYSHTQRLWLLVNVIVSIISAIILAKEKLPASRIIVLGACLAIAVGFTSPIAGVATFLAFMAAMRIFEQVNYNFFILKRPIIYTLFLGGGVGLILGLLNLFLSGSQNLAFAPSFFAFIVALNPGISEEIIYRLFIYALTIYIMGRRPNTHQELIWLYLLMIVPHVFMHFPDRYFVNGVLHLDLGTILVGPAILSLLFGLPMTLLMVRWDLASAIITHTLVDFIRFIVIGLPF